MTRTSKLTQQELEQARQMLADNKSILQIARTLGVSNTTLYNNGFKRGAQYNYTSEEKEQIRQLYIVKGLSANETIAELRLTVSRSAIIGLANRNGWTKGNQKGRASPGAIALKIKNAAMREQAKVKLWHPPEIRTKEPTPIATPKPKQAKPFAYISVCQWFDEPCSEPVTRGAYCEAHGARVYAGLPGKKKAIGVI